MPGLFGARWTVLAALLAAAPGWAGEGFRLVDPPPAERSTNPFQGMVDPSAAPTEKEKNFFAAAAGVVAFELIPWSYSRYVTKADFARISMDTVRANFESGFTYDHDNFKTNQSSHPYHGSLFYNSGRSNGYTFWESGLFAASGSFLWETLMEKEPPAINDLVNTTLGGMTRGEVLHRLSTMLLDNTASGSERFWRELGGLALNPVGGLNRLFKGQMKADAPNPSDRFPSRFYANGDLFYRHRSGSDTGGEDEDKNQAGLSVTLRYGDMFDGEHRKPFEFFELETDLAQPAAVLVTRSVQRGVLTDWTLGEGGAAEQRVALFFRFDYYNDSPMVYGAQAFTVDHFLRLKLANELELRTEAGLDGMPMIGVEVDYQDAANEVFGRSFAYGPGGGAHAYARLRRREIDLVKLGYAVLWSHTSDGASENVRIQSLIAEGRFPLGKNISLGAGWGWSERLATYAQLPTVELSGTQWRLFGAWTFR